jgi:hypothetical protein
MAGPMGPASRLSEGAATGHALPRWSVVAGPRTDAGPAALCEKGV